MIHRALRAASVAAVILAGSLTQASPLASSSEPTDPLALEGLIPAVRQAIVEVSFYDAHELTDFKLAPTPMKECTLIVSASVRHKKYPKSFNVCVVLDPVTGVIKAQAFYDYGCKVICGYPHRDVVEHYFSVSGYHTESPEQAYAKVELRCQKETDSTGRLLKMASHGGPDNQRTAATLENSCFPSQLDF